LDAATNVRRDTIRALESMGIPVEYHHHEVGPSQHEIDIRYAGALDMADYMLTYRLVVKEVAKQHGYHATFMPKPLFGENGSGMQPLPHVRGAPARGARGDRAGLRAPRPDGDEPVPPHPRAAARARHRLASRDARRGDRRALAVGAHAEGARQAHLRPLRGAEA